MMKQFVLAPLLAIALAGSPVLAATNAKQPSAAAIPFANHGGIRDWVAEGDRTLYVQDNFRKWYRATLFAPAFDLPFAQAIGFDTRPMGTLDRWSAVIVRGQRYPISSFERVEAPPRRKAKEKASQR